ncbi:MAG TPA: PadR family transcriptional regulator [Thermomicrobiales bacterium]|jgi:DNA-binding PadR family transcriptional regulator
MVIGTDDSWDERALLLLGALMIQSQHGYQLNDFIERCRVAVMKKPTAYAILDRLAGAGHISVNVEQEGNRPPRKVYTITPTGEALFYALLRANLRASESLNFAGDIGLMFLDRLPRPEAIACLRQRLAERDAEIAVIPEIPPHTGHLSVALAMDHLTAMRRADRDWVAAAITRLERDDREVPA